VAEALSWKEWWKRHGQIYTFVDKPEIQRTGDDTTAAVNPQVEMLIGRLLGCLSDKHFDVRASAAIALGKLGRNTPEIRGKLLRALKDRDESVKESAVLALGMIKAVEATDPIVRILTRKRNKTGLRCFAAVSLGLMRTPANLAVLESVFNAPDTKPEVKAGTLLGLGLLKHPRAAYTLYPVVMSNNKEELQSFAVTALAKIGTTEIEFRKGRRSVTVDLVDMFEKKLAIKETKGQVRRALAMALGTVGRDTTSLQALIRAYRVDRDKGVKAFALLSLARMKKSATAKIVVRETLKRALLREKDAVVQGFAALAAGLSRDEELAPHLLDVFNGKTQHDVRAAAAVGLGLLKHKAAIPDLASEVERPKSRGDARGYAAVALGMIGEPVASDYLKAVLKDVNVPYLKWAASTGLALLGDRSAVPTILKWTDDRNRITRESAIRSLAHFRDDSTIRPLLERFRTEKNDEVRSLILVTLGTIGDASEGMPVLRRIGQNVNWVAAVRMPAVDLLTRLF
jgi:HEAT repeat protein